MKRTALVAMALLAVACSGDKKPGAGDASLSPTTSTTASGTSTPSASGSAGPSGSAGTSGVPGSPGASVTTGPSASGGASGNPSTKPSGPSSPPPTANAKLEAKLTKNCVTRGGVQTLSIDSYPDMFVVFDTQYKDGKDGQVYGGFEANGRTNADGHYQKTWVVAPTAPLGDARVDIAVAGKYKGENKTAVRQLHFMVATSC